MLRFTSLRSQVSAVVLTCALLIGAAAQASDCYQPRCYWKTVAVYVTVEKPCTHYLVKYDHCGQPYLAKVVTYKKVQVPVERKVKVCY